MAPGAPTYFWSIKASSTAEIDHILTWCYEMEAYDDRRLPALFTTHLTLFSSFGELIELWND